MPSGPRSRPSTASRTLAGSIVVATLAIGAASGLTVMQMRASAWDQVGRVSQNLLESVEHMVDRNIELYDLSLQAVVEGLHNPEAEGIAPGLRQAVLFDRAATATASAPSWPSTRRDGPSPIRPPWCRAG